MSEDFKMVLVGVVMFIVFVASVSVPMILEKRSHNECVMKAASAEIAIQCS